MNYLLIGLGWIIGQTMGLGIALLSFKFYHKVFRIEKKSEAPISEFFVATALLLMGGASTLEYLKILKNYDKSNFTLFVEGKHIGLLLK